MVRGNKRKVSWYNGWKYSERFSSSQFATAGNERQNNVNGIKSTGRSTDSSKAINNTNNTDYYANNTLRKIQNLFTKCNSYIRNKFVLTP